MGLLDKWVCNSARAQMQFICIGAFALFTAHDRNTPSSSFRARGTAGHLTCYPNNMIKDGWLSSPMCMLLNLLSATVFFHPCMYIPYVLRRTVWVYVCMYSVYDYFCMSVCFPELKSWRWTAGPPGTGAHIICHITKGLRKKRPAGSMCVSVWFVHACVCMRGWWIGVRGGCRVAVLLPRQTAALVSGAGVS